MPNTNTNTAAPTTEKQMLPEGAIVTRVTADRIYYLDPTSAAHAIQYGLQARYTETYIER